MSPLLPKDPAENQPSVAINHDWCKGCGICVALCQKQVLAISDHEKSTIVEPKACVQCGICESHCPDMAIEVVSQNGIGE